MKYLFYFAFVMATQNTLASSVCDVADLSHCTRAEVERLASEGDFEALQSLKRVSLDYATEDSYFLKAVLISRAADYENKARELLGLLQSQHQFEVQNPSLRSVRQTVLIASLLDEIDPSFAAESDNYDYYLSRYLVDFEQARGNLNYSEITRFNLITRGVIDLSEEQLNWVRMGAEQGSISSLSHMLWDSILKVQSSPELASFPAYLASPEVDYWLELSSQHGVVWAELIKLSSERYAAEHCTIVESLEQRGIDWKDTSARIDIEALEAIKSTCADSSL